MGSARPHRMGTGRRGMGTNEAEVQAVQSLVDHVRALSRLRF
jgi:hypothetical protein